MDAKNLIRVGITVGDPNGIGCEVILKTFQEDKMFELCTPVVFGSNKLLSYYSKLLNINASHWSETHDFEKLQRDKLNTYGDFDPHFQCSPGQPDPVAGAYAVQSLKAGVQALKNNQIDVLVTAPFNKLSIQSSEFRYPGHTEYLEAALGGKSLMFMISDHLRMALLTNHVSLKEVVLSLSPMHIKSKIKLLDQSLREDFCIQRPKIAVLSINPHAGDRGVIGDEDTFLLEPIIRELFAEGLLVFGPYPADGFFGAGKHTAFDAVMASYHDQGLIPFKTLTFGQGVNFTAGLSKIRTSPDHGTAYDIAGQGVADPSSFREAVYKAIDIYRNRLEYQDLTKNRLLPLENKPDSLPSRKRPTDYANQKNE